MRQDYERFEAHAAQVLVIGTDDRAAFEYHWTKQKYPFVGLPDPESRVADLYGQQIKLLKFGRMPALMVIDRAGVTRYAHYGDSMSDIPPNERILAVLDKLNQEEAAAG